MASKGYTQETQAKSRRKRVGVIALIVVLLAAIGLGVGAFVFMSSTSAKLSVHDPTVRDSLVAAKQGDPYYVLLAADLDSYNGSQADTDAVILARVDDAAKRIVLLHVPSNLQIRLSDGNQHALYEAREVGGEGELITAVSSFAGVDISHYVRADAKGISALVGALGGVSIVLAEEVDDPQAGDVYLPAGEQTLDGNSMLTLLRARNFSGSIVTQGENRCEALKAVFAALAAGDASATGLVDTMAASASFATDWSSGDLISVLNAIKGGYTVVYGHVPGYELQRGTVTYFMAYTDSVAQIMGLMDAGQAPVIVEDTGTGEVDKGSFTIEVRNGSGVDGGAGMIADILRNAGYNVDKTGNADAYVYNETLVIYRDPAMLSAANAVLDTLRTGRVVDAGAFYVFEDDLLVVLGSDWKVVN